MTMAGDVWLAKSGAGVADYVAFYKASTGKGIWARSNAGLGQGQEGDVNLEADLGTLGLPCQTDLQTGVDGEGPMARIMRGTFKFKLSSLLKSVGTGEVADELFEIPAGYKVKEKQK